MAKVITRCSAKLAPKLGVTLTGHEVYARSDASVTGQVLKIIATKPDAVFIASAGTPAVLPQKALRERGYTGPIFQTHGVATEEFIKLGGKDVDGAIFTGEPFTIVNDLPGTARSENLPMTSSTPTRRRTATRVTIFGAHLWDSMSHVGTGNPEGAQGGKTGHAGIPRGVARRNRKDQNVYLTAFDADRTTASSVSRWKHDAGQ
jgi:branched-chain amino acid transport system substrate-binding protein